MKAIVNTNLFCPPLVRMGEDPSLESEKDIEANKFCERYCKKFGIDPPSEETAETLYPYYDGEKLQEQLAKDWVAAFNRYLDENVLPSFFALTEASRYKTYVTATIEMTDGQSKSVFEYLTSKAVIDDFAKFCGSLSGAIRFDHGILNPFDVSKFHDEFYQVDGNGRAVAAAVLYYILHRSRPFGVRKPFAMPYEAKEAFAETYAREREINRYKGLYARCFHYPVNIETLTEPLR